MTMRGWREVDAGVGVEKRGWKGAGAGLVLGPDKRTGTFGSHVIDGVQDLQEPGHKGRFLSGRISPPYQALGRDLCARAAS